MDALTSRRRRRRGRIVALAAAVCGIVTGLIPTVASGQGQGGCAAANGNCVMVIQISGLEPKDVTRENTPFLWAMSHPNDQAAVAPYTTLLQQRNGFTWQAPRGTMPAATAPATAALLTGGDPEQVGIVSDHFYNKELDERRLALDTSVFAPPIDSNDIADGAQGMDTMIDDQLENAEMAAFLGDPGLAPFVASGLDDAFKWHPVPADSQGQNGVSGNPAYCAPPRNSMPEGDPNYTGSGGACRVNDGEVLRQMVPILSAKPEIAFTFVQLAELGVVKERASDLNDPDELVLFEDGTSLSIAQTLQQTDAALFGFLSQYNQNRPDSFRDTTIFVTGDHGYEQTPVANRVPHPDGGDGSQKEGEDLEDYIENLPTGEPPNERVLGDYVDFIPQGTMATVYQNSSTCVTSGDCPTGSERTNLLKRVRDEILGIDNSDPIKGSEICVAAGGCIEEVLYVRSQDAPPGETQHTVAAKHPGWNLDHIKVDEDGNPTGPSGAGGELIVIAKEGWAFGKAAPSAEDPIESVSGEEPKDQVNNPWNASYGGPQNRAIAMLVNGPQRTGSGSLVNLPSGHANHFPVFTEENPRSTETTPQCANIPGAKYSNVTQANADPSDDANAPGHLCQAEIRDILPTTAALMQIAVPPDQLSGRILNEAFPGLAAAPCRFDCPPEPIIPDTFFTGGPVCGERNDKGTPDDPSDDECLPQQDDGRIPGVAETTERVNTFEFIGFPGNEVTAFQCKLDGGPWSNCSSPFTTPSFAVKSQHTLAVRAISPAGIDPTPALVTFEIIPIFDCDKPVCDLRAGAKKKRKLAIEGAFGNPHSLVTLSFYKQAGKKKCKKLKKAGKTKKFKKCKKTKKRQAKRAATSCGTKLAGTLDLAEVPIGGKDKGKDKKRKGKGSKKKRRKVARKTAKRKRVVRAGKRCKVKTLATFDPIEIQRGELKSKLKVPDHFSGPRAPTHLGVFIEEADKLDLSKRKAEKCEKRAKKKGKPLALCTLRPVGKQGQNAAGILAIDKAKRLKKPAGKKNGKGKGGKGKGKGKKK